MADLLQTIKTIRAKGVNTPRPGTDDTTVPTVQGDMPAGKIEPNPADNYKAVKNRMAQVKNKIIDENKTGEVDMPQEKVSASFLEALKQVQANAVALDEKKHKKHKTDAVGKEDSDIDNDGDVDSSDKYLHNRRKAIGKAIAKEEVEQVDEVLDTIPQRNAYWAKANAGLDAALKSGDKKTVKKRDKGLDLAYDKTINAMKKSRIAKEEVEIEESATVVLRKGGATKRMRYNPATIERMKQEGWVLASEQFVEKVKALFDIEEDISFEDAAGLVEAVEAKRGRGRPASAATLAKRSAEAEMRAKGQEPVKRGRGRPKKGSGPVSVAKAPETKPAEAPKAAATDAGDTQHILVQLRKAATNEPGESGSGKNTIKYLNNTTGQVSAQQARAALTKHDKLATSGDRFKAQRRMGGSHEGLTGFLAGKEEKTTAKPKVSLAQPGWNKK